MVMELSTYMIQSLLWGASYSVDYKFPLSKGHHIHKNPPLAAILNQFIHTYS
jgi:hypothetical protein